MTSEQHKQVAEIRAEHLKRTDDGEDAGQVWGVIVPLLLELADELEALEQRDLRHE